VDVIGSHGQKNMAGNLSVREVFVSDEVKLSSMPSDMAGASRPVSTPTASYKPKRP
jgi:hypothetical protein